MSQTKILQIVDSLVQVDSELSTTSTNPVQNAVVAAALDNKADSETVSNLATLVGDTPIATQISDHDESDSSHSDIRTLITELTTRLNTLADSDDTTLDQLSEIVAYIKSNRTLIEGVTTNKVNVTDIIDNLTTNVSNKPLSAAQGVALKSLIDALKTAVDGKAASEHTHDAATTSAAGFMSADDKTKLDGIATGANKTVVDSALSSTSANPVQNKVVNTEISNLKTLVGDTSVSEQINTAVNGINADLTAHTGNANIHVTAENKSAWNAKAEVFTITFTVDEEDNITSDKTYNEIDSAYNDGKVLKAFVSTPEDTLEGFCTGHSAEDFSFLFIGANRLLYIDNSSNIMIIQAPMLLPYFSALDIGKILMIDDLGDPIWSEPPQSGSAVQILTWEVTD